MISVTTAGYAVQVAESLLARDDPVCACAALLERFRSEQERDS
jgi:hypothetical protein